MKVTDKYRMYRRGLIRRSRVVFSLAKGDLTRLWEKNKRPVETTERSEFAACSKSEGVKHHARNVRLECKSN